MSHWNVYKVKFSDMDALAKAAKAIGAALVRDFTARGYSAQHFAAGIQMPGASYDIGLVQQEDGSWQPIYDDYDGSIEQVAGQGLVRLQNLYALARVQANADQEGLQMEVVDKGSEIFCQVELPD